MEYAYAASVCNPQLQCDIHQLENVQKFALMSMDKVIADSEILE